MTQLATTDKISDSYIRGIVETIESNAYLLMSVDRVRQMLDDLLIVNEEWAKEALFLYQQQKMKLAAQYAQNMSVTASAWKHFLPKKNLSVLEVGAGAGGDALALSQIEGINISVLEPSTTLRDNALIPHEKQGHFDAVYGQSLYNLQSIPELSYDVVYAPFVFHRLPYLAGMDNAGLVYALQNIKRLMKRGGLLEFCVNIPDPGDKATSRIYGGRVLFLLPPQEYTKIFARIGFTVVADRTVDREVDEDGQSRYYYEAIVQKE